MNVPSDVRQAKIQIRSESSLGAVWIAKDAKFFHVDNEDSDQTAGMRRQIWLFIGHTFQRVRFLTFRLTLWNHAVQDSGKNTFKCFYFLYENICCDVTYANSKEILEDIQSQNISTNDTKRKKK